MSEETTDQVVDVEIKEEAADIEAVSDAIEVQIDVEDTVEYSENEPEESKSVPEVLDDGRQWYVVQCFSLQEHKVRDRIYQMMEGEFADKVFKALLPEEETVEIKNNKRKEKITKIYPGYIFVQALPDQHVWFLLRSIPGVAKLVGSKNEPDPIPEAEIDKILRKAGDKSKKVEVDFEIGEAIKVVSGPFRGYAGVISEINADKGKLKSLISIFGRETPVELDFDQVEKTVDNK
ncbi:transcription termination/antitermination factor NusG [bacterium]|jgi:transcription termination/antitermination protein NusG|nr:transcription termination/antitermination factor NusG [bacterium]